MFLSKWKYTDILSINKILKKNIFTIFSFCLFEYDFYILLKSCSLFKKLEVNNAENSLKSIIYIVSKLTNNFNIYSLNVWNFKYENVERKRRRI